MGEARSTNSELIAFNSWLGRVFWFVCLVTQILVKEPLPIEFHHEKPLIKTYSIRGIITGI